jgi:outer membrane protein assembly factor BamB
MDLTQDGAGWTSLPQPFKRRGLALAAIGTKLYCIGGMSEGDSPSLAVDVLDTTTGQWSRGPELPPGKLKGFGASAATANGRLYVSGMSGVIYRLNTSGDQWESFAKLRTPRFFHRLLAADSKQLVAVGGEGPDGKLRDIEIVPLEQTASGWPGFHGARRDGVSLEAGWRTDWPAEGPRVAWRHSVGKGLSSFAVDGGLVFTLGNTNDVDTLWCLEATHGLVRWRFDYPCASTNHPMPIVPYGPASTPTVADGKVYSLSREGDFFCLEAVNGKLLWKTHLLRELQGKRPVYGYANSPLVTGGVVFLDAGGTNGSTVALDAATGALRWRAGSGEAGYSSPRLTLLAGRPTLALLKGEALTLVDPNNGALIATHPFTTRDFCNAMTPVVAGAKAVISNTGKEGTQRLDFAGAEPSVLWRQPELGLLFNSAVLWQGNLYAFNDAKRTESELVCLEPGTGKTRWSFKGVDTGVFTVVDGKMIVLTRKGELVVLGLGEVEPKVLARTQLFGGKSYAEPVLAAGHLYCRNNEGTTVCLDLRPAQAVQ